MSFIPSSRQELPDYQHVSVAISYLAPIAAISGTVVTYLLGLRTFAIVSLYATVPVTVASAAYFGTNRSLEFDEVVSRPLSWHGFKLTVILYFVLQGVSTLLVAMTEIRPYSYYLLVSLVAGLILFQILYSNLERPQILVVLFETSVLLTSILWSVTLNYYYYFGRTDVFPHDSFVSSLLELHYVTGTFGEYQAYPLWHIFVGFQTMLFDHLIDPLTLFFVTTGILYGLSTILVYAIARRFLFSRRISLIAALGMCLNPFVILYGMYSIPRSITSFLVLFCILCLLTEDFRASILYIAFVIGIAVYHTVSLPFLFVTIGCYYAVERYLISSGNRTGGTGYPVVSTWELLAIPIVQGAYWAVADPALVSRIVGLVVESSQYGAEIGRSGLTNQFIEAPYHELANYLPFGLILLFVLFAVIQSPRVSRLSKRGQSLLLTALVLSAISFPGPVLLVSVISNVTPDNVLRFGQYTYPFIVVAVAVGIASAVRTRTTFGDHRLKIAVVLLLVCSSLFLSVSNDFVASDNPVVERDDFYTFYLTESEVNSFNSITSYSDSAVTGDYITCRYANNPGNGECEIIQADPLKEKLHFPRDSVFILRKDELQDRPLSVYPTEERVVKPPYSNNRESLRKESGVWDGLVEQNRVYDSSEVTAYTDS